MRDTPAVHEGRTIPLLDAPTEALTSEGYIRVTCERTSARAYGVQNRSVPTYLPCLVEEGRRPVRLTKEKGRGP